MNVGGVELEPASNYQEIAEGALRGRLGNSRSTTDNGPLQWLFFAWPQIGGTDIGEHLSRRIAQAMLSDDPELIYRALQFFANFPHAPGSLTIEHLVKSVAYRKRIRGKSPPDGGSADLEWWLLYAMAAVSRLGDTISRDILRDEALRTDGKIEPIIHTLITCDPEWFEDNRAEILKLHPDIGEVIDTIESQS